MYSCHFIESRQVDSVAEYQDDDQSEDKISCICSLLNNFVNWLNSFYKQHKNKK